MTVLLIRHGMTKLGEEKRYQGSLDSPLSEQGRAALKRADFDPAHVYVSPMLRARETAAILFPKSEQIVVSDLREMDFGAFEGRGWWEMEHDSAYRAWVDGECLSRCPEGEDRNGFTERVNAAMGDLLRKEEDCAVIVAHGGTQMAALGEHAFPRRDYFAWQTACGCGWLLEYDRERNSFAVLQEVDYRK